MLPAAGMWRNAIRRMGVRPSGTAVLVALVVALLLGASFLLEGAVAPGARLSLVVRAADGGWATALAVPARAPDTAMAVPAARVPLVLGVRNTGTAAGAVAALRIHLPARFRLVDRSGEPYPHVVPPGEALARYAFPVDAFRIPPDDTVRGLPPLDTLWVEPWLPAWSCDVRAGDVPEFVPAPPLSAASLATPRLFWVLEQVGGGRQAGTLILAYDTVLVHQPRVARPPAYPAVLREPELPRPDLGPLRRAGTRQTRCGDPERPTELTSTVWETQAGGRFIVVYVGEAPRKHLFDLDRDSVVEMEMWDPDGDGRFEARRAARYPIPPFLLPPPAPDTAARDSAGAVPATTPPDTAAPSPAGGGPVGTPVRPPPPDTMTSTNGVP